MSPLLSACPTNRCQKKHSAVLTRLTPLLLSTVLLLISANKLNAQYTIKNRYSEYEPNYFLSNFGQGDYGQVKFKISFQYDLGLKDSINKVYFAYTQYAFWDLYKESAPMRELNFTPMLIYQHKFKYGLTRNGWDFSVPYLKIGYMHQSNGRSDTLNRSLFKVFAHTNLTLTNHSESKNFKIRKITAFPQVWIWNMLATENTNIADFQGYGQLITAFLFDWGTYIPDLTPLEISNYFIPAKKGSTYIFNVSFTPFRKSPSVTWIPNIYAQYYDGYGESLINFDNRYLNFSRQKTFRLGVQFRVK